MKSVKRHLAVLLGATAMLAACGGGGEQIDPSVRRASSP